MDKTFQAFPAAQNIDLSRAPELCVPCKGTNNCSWTPLIGRPRCKFATIQEFLDVVSSTIHVAASVK